MFFSTPLGRGAGATEGVAVETRSDGMMEGEEEDLRSSSFFVTTASWAVREARLSLIALTSEFLARGDVGTGAGGGGVAIISTSATFPLPLSLVSKFSKVVFNGVVDLTDVESSAFHHVNHAVKDSG